MNSILTSIKKLLGIEEEYTHFDMDIIMHVNAALMSLSQLGVGPDDGFFISDASALWADLLGTRTDIEAVRLYVAMKVRLMFDPPSTSYVLDAMERQLREMEWRLNLKIDCPIVEEVVG